MVSTGKCQYCGSTVKSSDQSCPQCGAPNPNYVPDGERTVFLPKTIEELKEYCAERGMPLLRMRFFVGEDYKQPKAFGIYRDGDQFVVYKNKANGERAIRYQGPDEAYAVNELFQKLLQECHNRGIYPDGKPSGTSGQSQNKIVRRIVAAVIAAQLLGVGGSMLYSRHIHAHDGYYNFGNQIYYHYGNDWYTPDSYDDWTETDFDPGSDYQDYFLGEDYSSDWGVTDFADSQAWQEIEEDNSSSSSDYDSWDSSDTDWDSDW